jgi:C4-type Zn-finger protein
MTNQQEPKKTFNCPHCGAELKPWRTPIDSSWAGEIRLVCFADDCPYFVKGWEVMMERQAVSCSYRHLLDPATGYAGPVPVWSKDALKDQIVEE